jgi:hypothetical protein
MLAKAPFHVRGDSRIEGVIRAENDVDLPVHFTS